jgi:hypothetical protein
MTSYERFVALFKSYPKIRADLDAGGRFTDEALFRATDWAWEQMSESEKSELGEQWLDRLADAIDDPAAQ